jgi:hypothetical protein
MSVDNVGKHLDKEVLFIDTRKLTLEKGLMSVEIVANPSRQKMPLMYTIVFTLEKGLIVVITVENLLVDVPT